ncbi:glycine--tRNA ligase subunit beta [Radiobacillus sp. PE A8.2]|uniref:glycine--tRNA ligase subunit beta n=1 Tax=Radiobacillus sp. PE A8.2 TaxID=3380349 RepID=UPI00388FC29B
MSKSDVLIEVGLEEMPARFLNDTQKQLEQKTKDWLTQLGLPYDQLSTYITPRRFAVKIKQIEDKQPDVEEEAKGPAKKIAVDENGNWTKAAIGFSKGQGVEVDDIYIKEVKGTEYIFVKKFVKGQQTAALLPSFKDVVLGLNFPKNMRWSNSSLRFIRPVRWILALYGDQTIPLEIATVKASNTTNGHRFLGEEIQILTPNEYEEKMKQQFVLVNPEERKQKILQGIKELETKQNWNIVVDDELLNEVTHLVEYPTVFYGSFSEEFLSVPEEALITSMKEHQRYFPVRSNTGELLPHFVAVRNGDDQYLDIVARGNEKVLNARLSDARFFFEEDQRQSIERNLEKLKRMVYQEDLGTIADKVGRVTILTEQIANLIGVNEQVKNNATRAAAIGKFDLVTNMVSEFTELQGMMGEKYALLFGENEQVARAINEQYMPRNANDQLPQSTEGAIVSIADKLDTIVGCIAVGIIPSGSQDPYALRRQALGILQIVRDQKWDLSVEALIELALQLYRNSAVETNDMKNVEKSVRDFFHMRAAFIIKEAGVEQDVIEAVLYAGIGNFAFTIEKAKVLAAKRLDPSFKAVQEALVRVWNLAEKADSTDVDESLFENDYEKALYQTYVQTASDYNQALENKDATQAIEMLAQFAAPIHAFFDHTMVMADEEKLKHNRLAILLNVASLMYKYANLSVIQWKQQA